MKNYYSENYVCQKCGDGKKSPRGSKGQSACVGDGKDDATKTKKETGSCTSNGDCTSGKCSDDGNCCKDAGSGGNGLSAGCTKCYNSDGSCKSCEKDYYLESYSCVACPDGSTSPAASNKKVDCKDGGTSSSTGTLHAGDKCASNGECYSGSCKGGDKAKTCPSHCDTDKVKNKDTSCKLGDVDISGISQTGDSNMHFGGIAPLECDSECKCCESAPAGSTCASSSDCASGKCFGTKCCSVDSADGCDACDTNGNCKSCLDTHTLSGSKCVQKGAADGGSCSDASGCASAGKCRGGKCCNKGSGDQSNCARCGNNGDCVACTDAYYLKDDDKKCTNKVSAGGTCSSHDMCHKQASEGKCKGNVCCGSAGSDDGKCESCSSSDGACKSCSSGYELGDNGRCKEKESGDKPCKDGECCCECINNALSIGYKQSFDGPTCTAEKCTENFGETNCPSSNSKITAKKQATKVDDTSTKTDDDRSTPIYPTSSSCKDGECCCECENYALSIATGYTNYKQSFDGHACTAEKCTENFGETNCPSSNSEITAKIHSTESDGDSDSSDTDTNSDDDGCGKDCDDGIGGIIAGIVVGLVVIIGIVVGVVVMSNKNKSKKLQQQAGASAANNSVELTVASPMSTAGNAEAKARDDDDAMDEDDETLPLLHQVMKELSMSSWLDTFSLTSSQPPPWKRKSSARRHGCRSGGKAKIRPHSTGKGSFLKSLSMATTGKLPILSQSWTSAIAISSLLLAISCVETSDATFTPSSTGLRDAVFGCIGACGSDTLMYGVWCNNQKGPWELGTGSPCINADVIIPEGQGLGKFSLMSDWNVKSVTDMKYLFAHAKSFIADISMWDVSGVVKMGGMFRDTPAFNSDISGWDVSNCAAMSHLFISSSNFNVDISSWDVSKVADFQSMFRESSKFTVTLCGQAWINRYPRVNTYKMWVGSGSGAGISSSLCSCSRGHSFDASRRACDVCESGRYQDENVVKTSSCKVCEAGRYSDQAESDICTPCPAGTSSKGANGLTDVSQCLLCEAGKYSAVGASGCVNHADLPNWDTSKVTDMTSMFHLEKAYNGDLSSWDVSAVGSTRFMFNGAKAFNSDLSRWDTSTVSVMRDMFRSAEQFNSDISGWDVSRVNSMLAVFIYAYSFTADLSSWDLSKCGSVALMLYDAKSISRPLCGQHWVASLTDPPGTAAPGRRPNQYHYDMFGGGAKSSGQGGVSISGTLCSCPRGHWFDNSEPSCQLCDEGTYQDDTVVKTSVCKICPTGWYQDSKGSTFCEDCGGLAKTTSTNAKEGQLNYADATLGAVIVSASVGVDAASNLLDGGTEYEWSPAWTFKPRDNAWVIIDLSRTNVVAEKLVVYNTEECGTGGPGYRSVKKFRLESSQKNVDDWVNVVEGELLYYGREGWKCPGIREENPANVVALPHNAQRRARFWRFTALSFHGTNDYGGLLEIQIYGQQANVNCVTCEANCAACGDGSTCTACSASFFLKSDGDCVTSGNCGVGFFADTSADPNACVACEANCAACSDGSTCTACSTNYFLKSDGDCVTSGNCGVGFFADNSADPNACVACEANCAACSDGSTCTTCSTNYFLKSDGDCVASGNCGVGFFADISADPNACVACEANCAACSDGSTCTACSTNYFLQSGDCSLSLCRNPLTMVGYVFSSQQGDMSIRNFDPHGLTCAAGFSGKVVATSCAAHNEAYSVTGCTPCGAGKYQHLNDAEITVCKTCPKGKEFAGQNITCASCPIGQYQDQVDVESVQCKACAPGKYSDAGASQIAENVCEMCAPGKYSDAGASQIAESVCKPCGAGKHQDAAGAVNCKSCEPGRYQNYKATTACKICEGGRFASTFNASVCKYCPAGRNLVVVGSDTTRHDQAEDCQVCEAGKYNFQPGLKIQCFDCETALNPGATDCSGCNPGLFKESGTGECIQCEVGRYSSTRDADTCIDCPRGYHGVEIDATSARIECGPCPRGKFGDAKALENATLCKACTAGRYSEVDALPSGESTSVPCKVCPKGRWSNASGLQESVGCKNCGAGRYNTASASTSDKACVPCGTGRHSATVGLSNPTRCHACPRGYSQREEGQAFCLPCVPGRHQDKMAQTSCKLCAINRYANKTKKIKCDLCSIGTVAKSQGLTSCSSCSAGKFGEAGPVCTKCHEGRYRESDTTSAFLCAVCPTGFYQDSRGQAACLPCLPGEFSNLTGNRQCYKCAVGKISKSPAANNCSDCDIGKYSDSEGSAKCTPCGAGEYSDIVGGEECKLCAKGRFRASGDGDPTRCDACPEGYSQNTIGQATCLPCLPGEFSNLTGNRQCYKCAVGKISKSPAANNCSDCDVGKYSDSEGSAKCTPCGAGEYSDIVGGEECKLCAKGRFRASGDGDPTRCDACPEGYSQNTIGQATCLPCLPGHFGDAKGMTRKNCFVCPEGWFSSSTHQIKCTECPRGRTSGNGSAACSKCLPGEFVGAVANVCDACPEGFYSRATEQEQCLKCPLGRDAKKKSTSCSLCLPGEFVVADKACNKCPRGYISQEPESRQCKKCDSGKGTERNGSSFCNRCPKGKRSEGGECKDCPEGTYQSSEEESTCIDCPIGWGTMTIGQAKCDKIPAPEQILEAPRNLNIIVVNDFTIEVSWIWEGNTEVNGFEIQIGVDRQFISKLPAPAIFGGQKARSTRISRQSDADSEHGYNAKTFLWHHNSPTYLQVRATMGASGLTSPWSLATEPWKLAVECTDDQYLNTTLRDPTAWTCMQCPTGASCPGPVVWKDVQALHGWWRVPWSPENATFIVCPFIEDCLGVKRTPALEEEDQDARPNNKGSQYHGNGTTTLVFEGCLEGTEGPLCSICEPGHNSRRAHVREMQRRVLSYPRGACSCSGSACLPAWRLCAGGRWPNDGKRSNRFGSMFCASSI